MRQKDRKIVLEDGSEYTGYGFGANIERVCEIVFNTSMVGYQEILSGPSYTDQMVVMTYPLIGNYGITDDDFETKNPSIGGLIGPIVLGYAAALLGGNTPVHQFMAAFAGFAALFVVTLILVRKETA